MERMTSYATYPSSSQKFCGHFLASVPLLTTHPAWGCSGVANLPDGVKMTIVKVTLTYNSAFTG